MAKRGDYIFCQVTSKVYFLSPDHQSTNRGGCKASAEPKTASIKRDPYSTEHFIQDATPGDNRDTH